LSLETKKVLAAEAVFLAQFILASLGVKIRKELVMTDKDKNVDKPEAKKDQPEATAESENTENQEHMIPKSRLDQINDKLKAAISEKEAAEKALNDTQEQRLKEQNKYKELYDQKVKELSEIKPKADRLDAVLESMKARLDGRIEQLPEDMKEIIPAGLPIEEKIDWLDRFGEQFLKPHGPEIGAGVRGAGKDTGLVEITPLMRKGAGLFGLTDEQLKRAAKRQAEKEQDK